MLVSQVETNPELISLSARDDVKLVLENLAQVSSTLSLEQFDSIQIYRGGVDLLRIRNKSRDCGRSAYVEIHEYRRRRIQHLLSQPTSSRILELSIVGLLAIALVFLSKK